MGVAIYEQHGGIRHRKGGSQVNSGGGFAHASLVVIETEGGGTGARSQAGFEVFDNGLKAIARQFIVGRHWIDQVAMALKKLQVSGIGDQPPSGFLAMATTEKLAELLQSAAMVGRPIFKVQGHGLTGGITGATGRGFNLNN